LDVRLPCIFQFPAMSRLRCFTTLGTFGFQNLLNL